MQKEITSTIAVDRTKADNIARVASGFKSNIFIFISTKRINCKSVLGLISLGLKVGDNFVLHADGDDELSAMESIAAIF